MSDPVVDDRDEPDPEIDCLKCGNRMQKVYIDALHADRCLVCGGLWLDATEKERLLQNPESIKNRR